MIPSQPAPPRSLHGHGLLREFLDEVLVAAELGHDLLGEGAVLVGVLASTLADGGKVLPIDGVVDMAAQVELDGLGEGRHFVVVKVGLGF